MNAILVGAGVFAVLVAAVGQGLRAGVFELGSDSSAGNTLKQPTTRVALFLVGIGFLGLALVTREDTPQQTTPQTPSLNFPQVPGMTSARQQPKLELSKTAGPPGTRLRVTGSGFEPGESVEIIFHATTIEEVQADTEGVFREVLVQVPTTWAFEGPYDIAAVGQTSAKSVDRSFRVGS
jgi:hypothetical protein